VAEPDPGLRRLQRWFGQLLDLTLTTEQEFRRELVGASTGGSRPRRCAPGIGKLGLARLLGRVGHPVRAVLFHWEGTGRARWSVASAPFDRTVRQCGPTAGTGRRGDGGTA
jgi:hypothetical protein